MRGSLHCAFGSGRDDARTPSLSSETVHTRVGGSIRRLDLEARSGSGYIWKFGAPPRLATMKPSRRRGNRSDGESCRSSRLQAATRGFTFYKVRFFAKPKADSELIVFAKLRLRVWRRAICQRGC